jgi:hypothetical protein
VEDRAAEVVLAVGLDGSKADRKRSVVHLVNGAQAVPRLGESTHHVCHHLKSGGIDVVVRIDVLQQLAPRYGGGLLAVGVVAQVPLVDVHAHAPVQLLVGLGDLQGAVLRTIIGDDKLEVPEG